MPWKPEYAERRKQKYKSDPSERERRKAQGRSSEENKDYMRRYFLENREKFKRTKEDQERHNARRRERYANDPEYAEKLRENARARSPIEKRNSRLKRSYGITQSDYEKMLEGQHYSCAICLKKHEEKRGQLLHVDHCHDTGKVRQLLCTACNTALGKMKDNPGRMRAAAAYIERHRD